MEKEVLNLYMEDTIAAIATPPGIGGVGIIRVSGKNSFSIVNSIFKSTSTMPLQNRPNRTIQYGHIMDEHVIIDEVLLLLMQGPHSYTAEDIVEIQCHGGLVPVKKILHLLLNKGIRLAEPGEFTRRAFLNGRIDLTQAEAIIDIIEAKTEDSLQLAMQQLDGTVGKYVEELRSLLITLIAQLEVTIDYPEEDIEDMTASQVGEALAPIIKKMDDLLSTANSGRLIRDGIKTVIIGLPNAGKSSLMNALLRENRAIVTDIPGTTRDSIEEYMNIDGISVRLIDTAGIRETTDKVEKIGVERAKEHLHNADLILCVIDGSSALSQEEKDLLCLSASKKTVVFINKSDMEIKVAAEDISNIGSFMGIESISAVHGEGTLVFTKYIQHLVHHGIIHKDYRETLGNIRHIRLMEEAKMQLLQAREGIQNNLPIEFIATDIRNAWTLLGDITGANLREDMVTELFSRFCLGK